MNLQDNYSNLIKMINYSLRDPNLELEVRLKENFNHKLDYKNFINIMKRVKGLSNIKYLETKEQLDIFFGKDNYRMEIKDIGNIKKYCKNESIKGVEKVFVINKDLLSFREINDYNIRFNLKRETYKNLDDSEIVKGIQNWKKLDKTFRYKKRYSFVSDDNRFMFDFSIVKSSMSETIRGKSYNKRKDEIKDYMYKYVIAPEYITDKKSWFEGLKDSDIVELMGKKKSIMIPKKTMKASNVLTNNETYEIEIEYIGNKKISNDNNKRILNDFIKYVGFYIQTLQNNIFIISESERKLVRDKYKILMGDYFFKGPQSVTLETKHILEKNYEDYKNIVSIRKGYTVTDKADGERNLLIVLDDGKCYLMNRKNDIKSLNCSLPDHTNSIFDGEYILKDKDKKNICLFMVFDIYIHKNEDLRERILSRSSKEIAENKIKESRLERLNTIFSSLDIKKPENNPLEILKKKFYYGDNEEYNIEINRRIEDLQMKLDLVNDDEVQTNEIKESIKMLKNDTKIFDECEKVYKKDYIYHIDGLIFTPVSLKVGQDYVGGKVNFNGRWKSLFKWKPIEENSIDFLVKIKKDSNDPNKDEIINIPNGDSVITCKVLQLMVGYDPNIHTKYNSFRVMNENLIFKDSYSPALFEPTNPFKKDIHICYVEFKNGLLKCEDGSIIQDNSIVEFSYNKSGYSNWFPMRVRETNKPNDFMTAINVWKTINNPVTNDNILTGNNIICDDNVYYQKNEKRVDSLTKPLADFHSYIKKKIITENSPDGGSLLDLACGKGGDLNHFLDTKLESVIGIDCSRDNLESINGSCNRVLSSLLSNTNELLDNIMYICGDCSKNIKDGSAANDQLSKYYLDIVYGNIEKSSITNPKLSKFYELGKQGFNIVSVQFAMHYFFESESILSQFLNNISESLIEGGKFIGTCLDGNKVNKLLKSKKILSKYDGDTLLWKIIKKYNDSQYSNSFCSNKIDIYFNSIGQTTSEYLVNFDYFINECKKYKLELIEVKSFEDLYNKDINYGSANNLTPDLMSYSFLNNYFIFQKI